MANSHEGKLSIAKEIVKKASWAGADAIKFQKFKADELVSNSHKNYNFYKNLEMKISEWRNLINYAKRKNLKVFVDVDGLKSAKEISKFNIDGFKIHATDQSNPYLLEFLSKQKKPILLSTAGSFINEIYEAIKILQKNPKEIVLMHGFQGYPTKLKDLNLSRIKVLKNKFALPVGVMDHVAGQSEIANIVPLLGICFGADVIEKHIILDRSKKGLDYFSALNPPEFKKMIKLIKMTKQTLGISNFDLTKNELDYRNEHKKKTLAKKFIKKGTKLNDKFFEFKISSSKAASVPFYEYRGRRTSIPIPKGTQLTYSKLDKNSKKIACVIACRVDSTRLFGKPLQLIDKFSILELLLTQIKKSTKISDIVLAISEGPGNQIFEDFARKNNLKYIKGDDKDVLKRLIEGAKFVNADIIFRVTSENPYIYWEGIDNALLQHVNGNYDYSIITPIPLGAGFQIINRNALEISHKKGTKRHRSEHCDLYIMENKNKFKINVINPEKFLQRDDIRLTVDTPQDLILVRIIFDALGNRVNPIPLKNIIKFLDENPELMKINSSLSIDTLYGRDFKNTD